MKLVFCLLFSASLFSQSPEATLVDLSAMKRTFPTVYDASYEGSLIQEGIVKVNPNTVGFGWVREFLIVKVNIIFKDQLIKVNIIKTDETLVSFTGEGYQETGLFCLYDYQTGGNGCSIIIYFEQEIDHLDVKIVGVSPGDIFGELPLIK